MRSTCLIFALALAALVCARPSFPPPKPEPVPSFHIPPPGRALDEGWQYVQTLVDAEPAHPELFNAYPVQIAFTHEGRGVIATLHTCFRTFDGGHIWENLDPAPPPNSSSFSSLRAPVYVSGIAARPVMLTSALFDSLFITTENATTNAVLIMPLVFLGSTYQLLPDTIQFYSGPHWLTGLAIPDSNNIFAFSGFDRLVFYRDSLSYPILEPLDSVYATTSDQWVAGPVAQQGSLIISVGGEQWISRNAGASWEAAPPADPLSDTGVSFADELHGMTGGGRLQPSSQGWVHMTTDGGVTWSARVLETALPIRCVEMVTPELGFAAGGNYLAASGAIWKTTDGGQTWAEDATMDAEITAIESKRESGAYVDVIAAGVYPDFRGGVWINRLYLPELSGPVLLADPDTLDFGAVTPGSIDTLSFTIQNVGGDTAYISGTTSTDVRFNVVEPVSNLELAPQQSQMLNVVFAPHPQDSSRQYTATLAILSSDGRTDITAYGFVPLGDSNTRPAPLPTATALNVWPNPGNAAFQIRYALTAPSHVRVSIFDVTGRESAVIAQGPRTPGEHVLSWNAAEFPSGIYFVQLEAAASNLTTKLLLIK